MIYAIAAQLAEPSRNGKLIDNWIRTNFDNWARPVPWMWIVVGPLAADQIYTGLSPSLSEDDRLVIMKAATEALWHGVSEDCATWLADNFPGSISERIPGKTEGLAETG